MIAADGAGVQAELCCWCDGCAIGLAAYARHAGWYILACSRWSARQGGRGRM